ncbi:hypothetical protein ABL78_1273 [Leptomonas seymouri]|uniref:Protein kinase domain-containing protein n=1 Tax=Leptomonas seymouri TaxID=5684 RepID=A0A0N1PDV5_LEPSE|nr:hypothetical protein ABL78_1273 [Leptomonas seymouri]|eukprot:KPI89608.1 hypothetical protein ABL78_1273 [Leptomonas seymouri]
MTSRFQQLLMSDSDEDSNDEAVIMRRKARSSGAASAHATPPPASIATHSAPAALHTKQEQSGTATGTTGTPRSDSMAFSKPAVLQSNSRSEPQSKVPRSGSLQSRTPSVGGGSALEVPVPHRSGGGSGSACHTPENVSLRVATAPQEGTEASNMSSMDDVSQHARLQRGVASAAQGTPHESAADSFGSNGQQKNTKEGRHKGVVRRRRDNCSNERGGVPRKDELVIRPGRQDGATGAANKAPARLPPPPSRVSPRALRAAASRSASRANSPAEGQRTPGGGFFDAPPQIPSNRADAHAATPRTPQTSNIDGMAPLSARSRHTDANAQQQPSIPPRSGRHSNGSATPRTPAENMVRTDSPIEFEVARGTATSSTVNFNLEDTNTRTDDTISFQMDVATTPRVRASGGADNLRRHPQIPSPSAFDESPTPITTDESGQKVMRHRSKVRLTRTADGRQAWVLFSPRLGESAAAPIQEIPAPPKRLSHRAQDILLAKRRAVESDVRRRRAEAARLTAVSESRKSSILFQKDDEDTGGNASTESELQFESAPLSENRSQPRQRRHPAAATRSSKRLSISRRTRVHFSFPTSAFYSEAVAQQHTQGAQAANEVAWTRHVYDTMSSCAGVLRASGAVASCSDTEKVVLALQPVQVAPPDGATGTCGCVVYDQERDDALRRLISDGNAREEGVRRYLNLQPMQLANVEMQSMVDPPLESPVDSGNVPEGNQRAAGDQRGLATLGGLWCTAEALREDGRPATRKDATASRRILRICGGQALGVPLQPEDGTTLDVRCYELLLFPRESLSPSAVNYGSEGLTLGQLIAPPASSFPLTPRIVDDPVALKEYKKRLLTTKNRQMTIVNNEDDRDTFADTAAPDTGKVNEQYLTLTMVTISSRQKYTIELTLVLLPFRSSGVDGGKTVAEVPRFCPTTVMTYRRLQGLALSFSTKSAFLSAYKALLWATECDIVGVQSCEGEDAVSAGLGYSKLRVCATSSPMVPWVASFGRPADGTPREETYHGNCLDFAVLTLAAPPEAIQVTEPEPRDPLTLEDFVIVDGNGDGDDAVGDGDRSEQSVAEGRQQRRSSIFTSTLVRPRRTSDCDEGGSAANTDTIVGLTPYGVIRRAVNQKTSEVFDVRVMPRNRGRMAPTWDAAADAEWSEAGGQTVKAKQEHLLQQDVEAAIMMEYTSRLPFHSRVYGVLVDEQRYYIFQEPWISALALEQSVTGSAGRDAIEYNAKLKDLMQSTTVMSLKDFIHAILHPGDGARGMEEEVKLQLAHVLAAQLLLLITSLHGKGMLLGPCPPQRVLVRIKSGCSDAEKEEAQESAVELPDNRKEKKPTPPKVQSSDIQLFLPDLGVNSLAWSYERQQCGVLEYLPPLYVLEQMLSESIGKAERAWTVHDDWWTYLTLCFELFSSDGTALVAPSKSPLVSTPTPTLTHFFSPVNILDVWHEVVADSSAGDAGTASETVGVRVRRYVHQRVLKSISRSLDSWISTKAEELKYFGTTAARRGRRVVRAVPPQSGRQRRTIGISLAAAYLQSARETSEASSITFETEDGEDGEDVEGESANILEEMPWIFQVRDFFDTVLDAVFVRSACSVHGPALRLFSHPFFRTVSLPHIFDGTFVFSAAVSHFALQQLTKSKVQAALLAYRTRAYHVPMAIRPAMPLMITGSAYNTAGGAGSSAPLLTLSSLACQEEQTTHEHNQSIGRRGSEMNPSEGLVFSRTSSTSQGLNGVSSPRPQSPAAAPWSQQRLRSMYNPTEWQSIAALETEVRGALNTFGPRESVSSRRPSADQDFAAHQVTISNRATQSARRDAGAAHAYATSDASSSRCRDPREYEEVVDSARDARPARVAVNRRSRDNGVSALPTDAYDPPGTPAAVEESRLFEQAPPQETYHSHPTYWQDGRRPDFCKPSEREAEQRSRRDPQQPRRARRHGSDRDIEQNFNDLVTRHAHMQKNNEPRRQHRRVSSGAIASSRGSDNWERRQQRQPQDSRPSSHQSSHHLNSRPSSRHSDHHHAWPGQFLDSATLQKKGQPRCFSDPQNAAVDCLTIDMQTQRSLRSAASNSHHGGSILSVSGNVQIFHESSSEESYVLVPSDDEVDTQHGHGSVHQPNGVNRESPVPRNPRGSRSGEVASVRGNYFAF